MQGVRVVKRDTITGSTFRDGIHCSATMSGCGTYRYVLERDWTDPDGPDITPETDLLTFVMLNPSTADALQDDPTIRRCIGFAREWGYGGVSVVNLYAFRSTDPRELKRVKDPVGECNLDYIKDECLGRHVVLAWGAFELDCGEYAHRCDVMARIRLGAVRIDCLGKTKAGHPKHPLYLPASTERVPW